MKHLLTVLLLFSAGALADQSVTDPPGPTHEERLDALENRVDALEGVSEPDVTEHTFTVEGTTSNRADYTFTVDGTLSGTRRLNQADTIEGQTATGYVVGGVDQYLFTGAVVSCEVDSLSDAVVTVDGAPFDGCTDGATGGAGEGDTGGETDPTEPDDGTTDPPDETDTGTVNPEPSTLDQLAACDPDVIYSGGSLNAAIDAVGDSGTLGFVEDVTFTDVTQSRIYSQHTSGVLRVCGVPTADGSKPVITAPLGTPWVFGNFHDVVIDNLELHGVGLSITGTGGGVPFHELRIDRVDFGQTGGRALFVSVGPSAIGPAVDKPGGSGDDPAMTSYITMTNTSMRDATGPKNWSHSQYIDRRGCVFRADNVSVEHVDPIEAFRSLCRVNVVINSYFSNVVREADGTLRHGREGRMDPYGATTIDFPACSAYIFRNNEFDIHGSGQTVAAIGMRGRLSITTCDMPNNWHLENLTNHVPWDQVSPEVSNPHLFPVFIEGNTFRYTGTSGSERIISNWGTYPRRHTQPVTSSSNVDYLAVPDAWKERNVIFWKDNVVEGGWGTLFGLALRQNKADSSDPGSWEPHEIPPVTLIETTEALPQTCDDLSYLQWWDEPGDHTGFPACP